MSINTCLSYSLLCFTLDRDIISWPDSSEWTSDEVFWLTEYARFLVVYRRTDPEVGCKNGMEDLLASLSQAVCHLCACPRGAARQRGKRKLVSHGKTEIMRCPSSRLLCESLHSHPYLCLLWGSVVTLLFQQKQMWFLAWKVKITLCAPEVGQHEN